MDVPQVPQTSQKALFHLSHDDRLRIRTLREVGWTYEAIATHIGCTQRQVQYTVNEPKTTPTKHTGRPVCASPEDVKTIVDFVTASKSHRQMPWSRIPKALNMGHISTRQVTDILRRAGFSRYVARKKPPMSETNR